MTRNEETLLADFVRECDHIDTQETPFAQAVAAVLWRALQGGFRFLDPIDEPMPCDEYWWPELDEADNDPWFGPSHAA
jgi:hypothetical protein